jgi:hypothetical protein
MPISNFPAADVNSSPTSSFHVSSFADMDLDGGDSPWGGMGDYLTRRGIAAEY